MTRYEVSSLSIGPNGHCRPVGAMSSGLKNYSYRGEAADEQQRLEYVIGLMAWVEAYEDNDEDYLMADNICAIS